MRNSSIIQATSAEFVGDALGRLDRLCVLPFDHADLGHAPLIADDVAGEVVEPVLDPAHVAMQVGGAGRGRLVARNRRRRAGRGVRRRRPRWARVPRRSRLRGGPRHGELRRAHRRRRRGRRRRASVRRRERLVRSSRTLRRRTATHSATSRRRPLRRCTPPRDRRAGSGSSPPRAWPPGRGCVRPCRPSAPAAISNSRRTPPRIARRCNGSLSTTRSETLSPRSSRVGNALTTLPPGARCSMTRVEVTDVAPPHDVAPLVHRQRRSERRTRRRRLPRAQRVEIVPGVEHRTVVADDHDVQTEMGGESIGRELVGSQVEATDLVERRRRVRSAGRRVVGRADRTLRRRHRPSGSDRARRSLGSDLTISSTSSGRWPGTSQVGPRRVELVELAHGHGDRRTVEGARRVEPVRDRVRSRRRLARCSGSP